MMKESPKNAAGGLRQIQNASALEHLPDPASTFTKQKKNAVAKSTEILRGTYQGNQGGDNIQYSQAAPRSSSNLISKQQQIGDRPLK